MADSLLFDGSDVITMSPGNWAGTGAVTAAAVVKLTTAATAYEAAIGFQSNYDDGFFANWGAVEDDAVAWFDSANPSLSAFTLGDQENWCLIAFCKPSGSDSGRFHKYVWDTTTWSHSDGDTATTSFAPGTSIYIGAAGLGGDYFLTGNILIAGVWDSELSDGAIEALIGGKTAWNGADEAWRFDTLSTITSFATGHASAETARTGTTVDTGDAPAGWSDGGAVTYEETGASTAGALLSGVVERPAISNAPETLRVVRSGTVYR